ncbi:MAG: UvrD-helicase domain-containing protein [Bacteroides sp.]|nr:UvrD-helicase domain-containing protein [Bacteroides sp.]
MTSTPQLLIYKASAGSGKTFTLAVEYIKLLIKHPKNYRNILAVTFTNKATTEMKERILGQLHGISIGDGASEPYLRNICEGLQMGEEQVKEAAKKALQYIIHDYSWFRVETIDSFFQSVIRNLARELELNSSLNLELNNTEVLSDAVDSMIEKLDRNSPVLRWLLDYIEDRIQNNKRWNVSGEIKNFGRTIFDETYIEKGKELREKLKDKDYIAHYRKELKTLEKVALEEMKELTSQFHEKLAAQNLCFLDLKNGARGIGNYFKKLEEGNLTDSIRNQTVEKCLCNEEEWCTKTSKDKDTILSLASSELMPLLKKCEELRKINNRIVNSCRLSLRHVNNIRLLVNIDEEVRKLNDDNNRFLLSDTNALLHELVRDGDSSFVFEKIGASIRNIMIDEFQDTSQLQWENLKLLLLEGLSQGQDSLIVGDVKQSIYRWHNGNWKILNELNDRIEAFPVRVKTLNTNRRSEAAIIAFNNEIFTAACNYLNDIYCKELGKECEELKKAYSDVCQECTKEEKRGYVKLSFLKDDKEHDYQDNTLDALAYEVEQLVEKGVKQSDITILVRKNRSIPKIAGFFEKNLPYKIVSDEAFRLDASVSVCMLVDGLRCLSNPQDRIAHAQVAYNYQKNVLLNDLDLNRLLMEEIHSFLPEGFKNNMHTLRFLPLYELVERLYCELELQKIKDQDNYLLTFFDSVLEYLQNNSPAIDSFISHWEEKLCARTIPAGKIEGIRIMSIHKSKGLEFHTVLIPYCDWKLENETLNHMVWCIPKEAPFNGLDMVPVNYCSTMAQSIYQEDFLEERLQLWVDNLNLVYVAFTRAVKNLIIWGKEGQKGTVSELLYHSVSAMLAASGEELSEEGVYETGEIERSIEKKEEKKTANKFLAPSIRQLVQMNSFTHRVKFRQTLRSSQFVYGEEEVDSKSERYIKQGRLLHALFSGIKTTHDIEKAINRLVFDGLVESYKQEEQLRKIANFALSHPRVAKWYSGEYKLYNECVILYRDKNELQTRRPDRVMVKDNEIVVVDFKFGKRQPDHVNQISEYMNLLLRMGHPDVKGYIWYVFENKLQQVTASGL